MIKKWLGITKLEDTAFQHINIMARLEARIAQLEKPRSIAEVASKLHVTMRDGGKKHAFTAYRVKGRFAKKPK